MSYSYSEVHYVSTRPYSVQSVVGLAPLLVAAMGEGVVLISSIVKAEGSSMSPSSSHLSGEGYALVHKQVLQSGIPRAHFVDATSSTISFLMEPKFEGPLSLTAIQFSGEVRNAVSLDGVGGEDVLCAAILRISVRSDVLLAYP